MLKIEEELRKFLSYCYSLVQKRPLALILKYTKRTGARKILKEGQINKGG